MISSMLNAGPAKILVVDDHPNNLTVMEAVLGGPEYILMKASSGKEALALVEENDFALVILDIQMPDMDGFETAEKIKKLPQGKNVPLIFVTAIYKEDPFIRKGYEIGAIDYFGKPFDPEILKAKVSIYANLYRQSKTIKNQEKQLAQTEELLKNDNFKHVLETLPVGVMVADLKGNVYQTNEEAQKVWGCNQEKCRSIIADGAGWWVESGKAVGSNEWAMMRSLRSGETFHNELVNIQSFDGAEKTILNSASPLRGTAGEIVGVVGVVQDITRQRQIEEEILKRYPT